MSKFVPLVVKQIIRETADASTVVFQNPGDGSFNYKPGQYLTLKMDIAGESIRRAYSLCSSPITETDLAVTVKAVPGGKASNFINSQLQVGQTLEVFPPMGNFCINVNPEQKRHLVLIGGGSGITPLMSILKSVLEAEPESHISLIYGNNDEQSIIFKAALEELSDNFPSRLRIIHILARPSSSWIGMTGMPQRQLILGIVQDLMNADALPKSYWVCGPAAMMEEAQAALGFLGVPKDHIRREVFTAALPSTDEAKPASSEAKRGNYTVTVKLDGKEKQVLVKENQTILEAVIGDGMDPPYACQMGVCCTCRAIVTSGKVEMEEDEGLSDAEIADGYVLTCQSHPMTPDVVLEYK